jgi:hypothetical protein
MYRSAILPVILYGCETWYLTAKEKHRLKVFKNRVWRKTLEPKKEEVKDRGHCTVNSFIICTPYQMILK